MLINLHGGNNKSGFLFPHVELKLLQNHIKTSLLTILTSKQKTFEV